MSAETFQCRRCEDDKSMMEKAPFRNEIGERILAEICASCWQDWLEHQTSLINHYGLDPRDSKAREFLYEQIEKVLLGDGNGEDIDTSKQGSIKW